MIPMVRIYGSEQSAQDAAAALEQVGFTDVTLLTAVEAPSDASEVLQSLVSEGRLPGSHIGVCQRSLTQGGSVVLVTAPFGRGQDAVDVMERFGPVDTDALPAYLPRNPSPFSDLLGLSVLSDHKPVTELAIFRFVFGEPKVTRNAAPLSSRLGLPLLSSFGRDRRSSLGLPLLSRNPAPLSSLIGLKAVSSFGRDRRSSFGLSLLSRNPAPLSSLLGLPLLSKKKKGEGRD